MQRMTRWFGLFTLLSTIVHGVPIHAAALQTPSLAEELVLQDDFDNPATSLFQAEEGYGYSVGLDAGALRMEVQNIPPGGTLSLDLPAAARDGTIEVDSRLINAKIDHHLSVGCRGSLNTFDAGYTFMVSPVDGFVGLYRREQGLHILLDMAFLAEDGRTTSEGGETIHHVGLRCHNATLTGQVNGVDVVSATDHQFAEGYFYIEVGLFSDATANDSAAATFDNLLVTVPPEEAARQRTL